MSRRRWVYTEGGKPLLEPYEVSGDWSDAPRSTGDLHKFQYDNLRATDGTDISSRTKRRNYMKHNGVTDMSDFKGTWEKAEKEREAFKRGDFDRKERRETIGRIAYQKGWK